MSEIKLPPRDFAEEWARECVRRWAEGEREMMRPLIEEAIRLLSAPAAPAPAPHLASLP